MIIERSSPKSMVTWAFLCLFYRFTAYPAIPPAHLSFGLPRWLRCGAFQHRFRCLRLRLGFGFGLGRMAMGVSINGGTLLAGWFISWEIPSING